ncbi:hypothetical protein MKC66_08455 [[Clostridium] innocuum]|nr:hypothetical protein [[Clostridium] innocuum]
MNFLVISPQFPATNWNFCDRLKLNGINTLGIGYVPYEELRIEVRHALQDYIQIQQSKSYDAMLRAAAFFIYRYGRLHGIESFQEANCFVDARLRTDFHVTSGSRISEVQRYLDIGTRRAWMKACGLPLFPAQRAVSRQQLMRLMESATSISLYTPEQERLRVYQDKDKLLQAVNLCHDMLLPAGKESLYVWEALLDHQGNIRIEAMQCNGLVIRKAEKKELSDFAEQACLRLTKAGWSCSFVHMLLVKQQSSWAVLDIHTGADCCHLLHETQDIYQLWADCICEEMEQALDTQEH